MIINKLVHKNNNLHLYVELKEEFCVNFETMENEKMYIFSASANIKGSGGQCLDEINYKHYRNGTRNLEENIKLLVKLWKKYHLNNMKPGTKKQCEFLQDLKKTGFDISANNYDEVCEILEKNNLLFDRGYKYGSSWLCEKIKDSDLVKIKKMMEYFYNV